MYTQLIVYFLFKAYSVKLFQNGKLMQCNYISNHHFFKFIYLWFVPLICLLSQNIYYISIFSEIIKHKYVCRIYWNYFTCGYSVQVSVKNTPNVIARRLREYCIGKNEIAQLVQLFQFKTDMYGSNSSLNSFWLIYRNFKQYSFINNQYNLIKIMNM